jgi:aldose 1-epimerase
MDGRIALKAGALCAELAPEHGGRLTRLVDDRSGAQVDIVPPLGPWEAPPRSWPKQGAYPLFPYSNRVTGAALRFGGHVIPLREHPAAPGFALHGPAHLRAWRVVAQEPSRAVLAIDYAPDADWPWPFRAEQEFALASDALRICLSLRNDAGKPAPAGIGWHPYLSCGDGSVIRHDAARLWPCDADFTATGASLLLDGASGDNAYLSEWTTASLIHPDGSGIHITADAAFGHLILHRPLGAGYACIEPVSHVADGFNLAAAGVAGTGTVVLAPGETLAGIVTLNILRP